MPIGIKGSLSAEISEIKPFQWSHFAVCQTTPLQKRASPDKNYILCLSILRRYLRKYEAVLMQEN